MLLIDLQGCRQETLHYVGVGPEIQQHTACDHALNHGQHL